MTITNPRHDAMFIDCDAPQCTEFRSSFREGSSPSEFMMKTMLIDSALRRGWTLVGGKVSTHFCPEHTPPPDKTYIPPVIT